MINSWETKNIQRLISCEEMQKEGFSWNPVRFIRDPELRIRMIENHRDEDLCRRWVLLRMKITLII